MAIFAGAGAAVVLPPTLLTTGQTVQSLIDDTRYLLLSGQNEQLNKLATPYSKDNTVLQMRFDLGGITAGSTISVGLNTFHVWTTEPGTKTITVEGGVDGSVDSDLDGNSVVRVRPKYTDARILRAINDDLADLSSPANGLYAMKATVIPFRGATIGYDLPGVVDLIDIYEVRYSDSGSRQYRNVPRIKRTDYRLERVESDPAFPSGMRLELFNGGRSGMNVTVLYKAPYSPLGFATQSVASTGLHPAAFDLPPMGAALGLMAGREIRRNDTTSQGDTRRADEVPPGAVFGSTRGLSAQRERRVQGEASRLQAAYPVLLA